MKKVILLIVGCVAILGIVLVYLSLSKSEPRALHKKTLVESKQVKALESLDKMPIDVIMEPDKREIPGKTPTWGLRYKNNSARKVFVSGTWDGWDAYIPMVKKDGMWLVDLRPLHLTFGRNDFKFLPNGKWEKGDDRVLYINEEGMVERPSDKIFSATLDNLLKITVSFRGSVDSKTNLDVRLRKSDGEVIPVKTLKWIKGNDSSRMTGFTVSGGSVIFSMAIDMYGLEPESVDRVSVAGTFNNWNANAGGWQLHKTQNERVWELAVATSAFGGDFSQTKHEFKFVVNGSQWMRPSISAPNAISDGKGNTNLLLDPKLSSGTVLQIYMKSDLDISEDYTLLINGLGDRVAYRSVFPLPALDMFKSDKVMGATLDKESNLTHFRIFSPRAKKVELCIYASYEFRDPENGKFIKPESVHTMKRDSDGVWEVSLPGLLVGAYYAFKLDGPTGAGEGFDFKTPIGDPCARAVAHARNCSIVIDPDERNRWFNGWTDQNYSPPSLKDVFIYETHVRDLTINESSGVEKAKRGRYSGVIASIGTGTGLDHLKKLGINMIEFMPISEFENGVFGSSWGYSTAFYAAPEASYGTEPLKGSQYYEFNALVDKLHNEGFGVILDVVYNHVGTPNVFYGIDRKYYFRQNFDFVMSNFSGCGNDVRTEAPMMRKFIVDNILYWMREHHVDGFRFDLAELIDMKTLRQIEKEARALNPAVILISEPWSFRGDQKRKLKNTSWSAWNDEFRDPVKHFISGHGDRNAVMKAVTGSEKLWTGYPLQSVNYLESHDDMCLTDELSTDPDKNGMNLTDDLAAKSRLGATILMTSLGIPMLSEGQEFLRSKYGIRNSFDRGDAVNALRWNDCERPLAKQVLDYYIGLSKLRNSSLGRAFKVNGPMPDNYYRWIMPQDNDAFGYMLNLDKANGKASFIVLVNAAKHAVDFNLDFPAGNWKLIGDGKRIRESGVGDGAFAGGIHKVRVERLGSMIFMRR